MKLIILPYILVITSASNAKERIVGGQIADFPLPYQAGLLYFDQHICGGAIIQESIILTAAHCIYPDKDPKYLSIVVGTNYWRSGGQQYAVLLTLYHEAYDNSDKNRAALNDIALVKTASPMKLSKVVQPIKLFKEIVSEGSVMLGSGWGYPYNNAGEATEALKILITRAVGDDICNRLFGVTTEYLCTFSSINNGICSGDSGGPLVYKQQLVGILSGGAEVCGGGFPDLYVRVSSYIDWIKYNVRRIL